MTIATYIPEGFVRIKDDDGVASVYVEDFAVVISERGTQGPAGEAGGFAEIYDDITVDTDGQTAFAIPDDGITENNAILFVNGVAFRAPYFNISGTTLTWNEVNYSLRTTFDLFLQY